MKSSSDIVCKGFCEKYGHKLVLYPNGTDTFCTNCGKSGAEIKAVNRK